MRAFEPWHLLVLVVVVGVLFGGKRLPGAARGLGQSLRIFKSEMREMRDEPPSGRGKAEPGPIEGRVVNNEPVVDNEAGRTSAPTDKRTDA